MGLSDLVQKAVYLGIGVASYASEKAGSKLNELRQQLQTVADEMVARGEMTTEEARKFVEEMLHKAQQSSPSSPRSESGPPRKIDILDEDEANKPVATSTPDAQATSRDDLDIDTVRRQVEELQAELRRLRKM
jgi:polyhydroxyalkanoate synthesis regulator phasin